MKNNWMLVIALCFLAALFEGLDIQSMGVAAPRLVLAFGIDPQQLGFVLSASTLGLMIGAALGGWASDRWGRKLVLTLSMLALGVFSLLTAASRSYDALLGARLLAGLGLGGAFPNLIALTADRAPPQHRVFALGLVYCGMPLGGAAAGALMSVAAPGEWQLVFLAGGIGPLALVPLLAWLLPRSVVVQASKAKAGFSELFEGRHGQTLLLWLAYFFTLLAVYLLLNWLPSLMGAKGLDKADAARSAVYLNLGAVVGSLILGRLSDRTAPRPIFVATYAGMLGSILFLVLANTAFVYAAAFAAGFFVIGGQLVLYALAPAIYPEALRGTGIGAAVAVGRAGSVLGPILGGAALAHGWAPNLVPIIAAPGLVLALAAALVVVSAQVSSAPTRAG